MKWYAKRDATIADASKDKVLFDKSAQKVKQKQAELKSFSERTGNPIKLERTQVVGYNKSVAGKVTQSAKRQTAAKETAIAAKQVAQEKKADEIRALIKSDATNKKINKGNQNKHILGSKGYVEGRSYIYGDLDTAQTFVDKYHGTGDIRFSRRTGEWTGKEFVTTNEDVGMYVNADKKEPMSTNTVAIHYGKRGTHIVPARRVDK